jgi:hypothetical protein
MQQVELAAVQHLLKPCFRVDIIYNYGLWLRTSHIIDWKLQVMYVYLRISYRVRRNSEDNVCCCCWEKDSEKQVNSR